MHDGSKARLTKMILIMSFSAVEQPYQTVPFSQWPGQPLSLASQVVIEARKKKKEKVHQWSRKRESEAREKVETGH